jgi:hypothetical protein
MVVMDKSYYILAISPLQSVTVPNIFHLGPGSVGSILEQPGSFRYAGWDLNTLDRAIIKGGEAIEVSNGERKVVRLYEDGALFVRGLINEDFLGWGTRDEAFAVRPRVHPLALIEFSTATVFLYKRIVEILAPVPESVAIHQEIINGRVSEQFMYTVPYRVGSFGYMLDASNYRLTDDNPTSDFEISTGRLREDPAGVAFEIVKRLFLFFGVPTNEIPYVEWSADTGRVMVDEIAKIR